METPAPGGAQPQAPAPSPAAPADQPAKKVETAAPLPPSNDRTEKGDDPLAGIDVTALSDSDLAALESGDPAKIAGVLKIPQTEETPAGGEVRKNEQNSVTVEGDEGPIRISLKAISSKEARVKMADAISGLRNGEFDSIEAALIAKFGLKAVTLDAPAKNEEAPAGEKESNSTDAAPPDKVTALQTQVTEKEAAIKTAKDEYRYDDAHELMMELIELKAELKLEKREAERAAKDFDSATKAFQAGEEASRNVVKSLYGELLADPDSPFNELLDVEIALAERKNDPILNKPDWPEKIAKRTYEKHKATLGGGKQADPDQPGADDEIPPAPPKREVRLPGSPVGGGANTTALTPTAALAEMETLSPDQQAALLDVLEAKGAIGRS